MEAKESLLQKLRSSDRLLIFIVAMALLLDYLLMTMIVPIMPHYIAQLDGISDTQNSKEYPKHNALDFRKSSYHFQRDDTYCIENINISEKLDEVPRGKPYKNFNITAENENSLNSSDCVERPRANKESIKIGLLFASKPVMQLIMCPIIGILTNKIGYTAPLSFGFGIMFFSTLMFAFGQSYPVLFVARCVQGIGTSCSSVAGMGLLASHYVDDEERGKAMANALTGLALGVLIGPTFGGVLYQLINKEAPFLILATVIFFVGILQFFVLEPKIKAEPMKGNSLGTLLKDPYIIITALAIAVSNSSIGVMEPILPMHMYHKMHSQKWQEGAIFLPSSIGYLLYTSSCECINLKFGRWLITIIGLVATSISLFGLTLAQTIWQLVPAVFGVGFFIGIVDTSMLPTLGNLVDLRHVSSYGSVYGIAEVSFSVGFTFGPVLGGILNEKLGFNWLMRIMAIITLAFCPFVFFLRNPPAKNQLEETHEASGYDGRYQIMGESPKQTTGMLKDHGRDESGTE